MLFLRLMLVSIRAELQYPASFLMTTVAFFLGTFLEILGLWALFDRFQMVKGWTLYEVGLIYGIIYMGFSLADTFARGFDRFDLMVKHGTFDRLLLRPLSPLIQVATSEVQLMKLGRFAQGLIVLLWSASHLSFSFMSLHTTIICLSVFGAACLFYGLFIIQATLSFWTIETLEIMNITTYGGVQTSQYPFSIYPRSFRWIFTLIIPLACVAYFPIAILLRHVTAPLALGFIAPLAGLAFLYLANCLWKCGVKHYSSTGS
jgi:ABC-2 type transport system permease protein